MFIPTVLHFFQRYGLTEDILRASNSAWDTNRSLPLTSCSTYHPKFAPSLARKSSNSRNAETALHLWLFRCFAYRDSSLHRRTTLYFRFSEFKTCISINDVYILEPVFLEIKFLPLQRARVPLQLIIRSSAYRDNRLANDLPMYYSHKWLAAWSFGKKKKMAESQMAQRTILHDQSTWEANKETCPFGWSAHLASCLNETEMWSQVSSSI